MKIAGLLLPALALALPALAQDGTLIESFDDPELLGTSGNTSTETPILLEPYDADFTEGEASTYATFDFVVDAGVDSESGEIWGATADIRGPGASYDLSAATGLLLDYQVLEPVAPAENVSLIFRLVDMSDDVEEYWQFATTEVLGDLSTEWQELELPFSEFTLPAWEQQGNGELDLDAIANWQIQINVTSAGAEEVYLGTILLDNLRTYGGDGGSDTMGPGVLSIFPLEDGPYVDTGAWLAWLVVNEYPWVFSYELDSYVYLSDSGSLERGGWLWVPRQGSAPEDVVGDTGPGVFAEYPLEEEVNIDTGEWLAWLDVEQYPWVYSYDFERYLYISGVSAERGVWIYLPQP